MLFRLMRRVIDVLPLGVAVDETVESTCSFQASSVLTRSMPLTLVQLGTIYYMT